MRRPFLLARSRAVPLLFLLASCSGSEPPAVPPGATTSSTGFFVGRDGSLVTAAHALDGCGGIAVASEQLRRTSARVTAVDRASDLALLRVGDTVPPGVLAVAPGALPASGRALSFGYPVLGLASPQVEADPQPAEVAVRAAVPDPRFARWWIDRRFDHGWSGAPVLGQDGVVGVILSIVTDRDEQTRLLGRTEPGLAAGTDGASVSALLARQGVVSSPSGRPRDAVVRVFCLR